MRIRTKIIILLLVVLCKPALAQDKGFTFLLGPSVNVFVGNNAKEFSYSSGRINWQFNGQLGYISTRGGTNRGNMLGVYASMGSTNPGMIALLKNGGAELAGEVDLTKTFNDFYAVEAGMTILKFLRLSGGLGRQYYSYGANQREMLQYFSGTIGLSFDLGAVNWVIDANMMNGKDLNVNVFRASTGFLVKF
jgi:hypothetical protein